MKRYVVSFHGCVSVDARSEDEAQEIAEELISDGIYDNLDIDEAEQDYDDC